MTVSLSPPLSGNNTSLTRRPEPPAPASGSRRSRCLERAIRPAKANGVMKRARRVGIHLELRMSVEKSHGGTRDAVRKGMPRTSEVDHELERVEEEQREPEPPPKRGKLLRFGVPALLVLLLVAGYFWWHGRNREATDDAQVDGHIAPISAKVSGSVREVLVDLNQHVTAGQVLVRLDPRDYQARVDQARAALTVAEAQAHTAQVGVPLTRATTASGASGAAAQV